MQDRVRFVLVHHEEAAAFMATAHAKATGQIGVCLATSGPGGIHLLNGLYDAKLDHVPVLAITGMQETALLGTGYQQEVNLDKLFMRRGRVRPDDLRTRRSCRRWSTSRSGTALARRGVAHLTVPNDIQVADAGADPWQHVGTRRPPPTAPIYLPAPGPPAGRGPAGGRGRAQRRREGGDPGRCRCPARPGRSARRGGERSARPIVKTLSGKAVLPDDSPVHAPAGSGCSAPARPRS